MNDCIINNYKKNNYKKNKKTNKNLDDYTNLTYVDKFMNSNNKIEDFNDIDLDNIKLIINEEEVNNTNKIFFLKDNDSTYNIKIDLGVKYTISELNKLEIKFDGEKKSDLDDFKEFKVSSLVNSNIIEENITLSPAVNYNLNILYKNENTNEVENKLFEFKTGHKLFNNNLLLKLNDKTNAEYAGQYKDFSSENNNDENDDIIYNSKKQCQYNLSNIFKGIEHSDKKYIDLEEIDMKPFNMVNFMIELPDFNNYLEGVDSKSINTIPVNNNDFQLPKKIFNTHDLVKGFIPYRFEIDKLYILNNDDLCPIVFNDNKYTRPKIEPMNIVQGLNKYLLTIKYVEDEYYGKTVKYLVKLKLIYQNLNFKETEKPDSKLVERETLPLVFCFTISKQSSIKNNLINKNLKFTENLEYKTKLKNKFINKQKEQDENLLKHQQELNSLLNDVKYEYEKKFN
tara:strand:- start:99 stop:1460 length:1362 start_codon:yes stop_codon:yes gene_type:complete